MRGIYNAFVTVLVVDLALYGIIISLIVKQIWHKTVRPFKNKKVKKNMFCKVQLLLKFFFRMFKNNIYTVELCGNAIRKINSKGTAEVAVYGTGFITKILRILARGTSFKISNVYDKSNTGRKYLGFEVLPLQLLNEFDGEIIIASLTGVLEKTAELRQIGIDNDRIIKL